MPIILQKRKGESHLLPMVGGGVGRGNCGGETPSQLMSCTNGKIFNWKSLNFI